MRALKGPTAQENTHVNVLGDHVGTFAHWGGEGWRKYGRRAACNPKYSTL